MVNARSTTNRILILSLGVCPCACDAENTVAISQNQKLTEGNLMFAGCQYRLKHPNAMWFFEQALSERWQARSEPDWSQGKRSCGATLSLHYASDKQVTEKSFAVTMADKRGAFYAVSMDGQPVREDGLLAKGLFAILAERTPRFTNIKMVDDEDIVGGFTPYELKWISSPELTERVSKERDEDFDRRAVEKGPSTRKAALLRHRRQPPLRMPPAALVYRGGRAYNGGRTDVGIGGRLEWNLHSSRGTRKIPVFTEWNEDLCAVRRVVRGHHLHPDAAPIHVPRGGDGLVQPLRGRVDTYHTTLRSGGCDAIGEDVRCTGNAKGRL